MSSRYQIRVYDHSGTMQALYDNWNSLNYKLRINGGTTHVISMIDGEHTDVFIKDAIVRVLRRTDNQDWYDEYYGLHRSPRHQLTEFGKPLFTSYGRGLEDLLNRPLALQYPNFGGVAGETAMKQLVDLNAGPNNTHGSQKIQVIAPTNSLGTLWYGQRNQPRLLDALKEIGAATGVDFSVVVDLAQMEFEFRTHWPQLGTDRTASSSNPHRLGPQYGNVKLPDYTNSATDEVTVARAYNPNTSQSFTVTDPAANDSPWNDIETIVTSDSVTNDGLQKAAEAELAKLAAQDNFSFEVVQTASSEYGRDYRFGDLITINFAGYNIARKIVGVDVTVAEGRESIRVEVAPYAPKPTMYDVIKGLVGRIKRVEEQL